MTSDEDSDSYSSLAIRASAVSTTVSAALTVRSSISFSGFTPTFVKRYTEAGAAIKSAISRYAADVRSGAFPGEGQSFRMKDDVLRRIYGG